MLLGDILRLNALKFPHKLALVCNDARASFLDLNLRANRLANGLLSLRVRKGDRVAVLADNCPQYVEAYFAAAKDGLIIVPLNTTLDAEGVAYIVNDSGANTFIFSQNYQEVISSLRSKLRTVENYLAMGRPGEASPYEELLSESSPEEPQVPVDDDDVAALMYTSGTTGPPKGVMLTHKNLISDTVNTILSSYPIKRTDVHLNPLPMFYMGFMWYMRCHFYVGSTVVSLENPNPELFLKTIEREKVTTIFCISPTLAPVVNHPEVGKYDLSSVRLIVYGGALLPEAVQRRVAEVFGDVAIPIYGLTEATSTVIMPPLIEGPWEEVKRPGSCGKEMIHVEVRLIDEEGQDCAPGQVGEILVRGDNVMKGYWGMPEATAKALEGGYLHTGDLAFKDEEGYYYITGRKKDVISSGGRAIYSPQIENVISMHPAVSEVAVIGVPDEELGEAIKAVVVLKVGRRATEEELIEWCKGRLENYQVPSSVDFISSLPKTASGKIRKVELRQRYS